MAREEELYLGLSERWRNIPKPTIAAVQGMCIAGGLLLAWPCDIILAAEDAQFQDPTVSMGLNGIEFFSHPWEVGIRKAKEMLFTSDALTAEQAQQLGMVNQVVGVDELQDAALAMAEKIAQKSSFALMVAKKSVNGVQDAQGREVAMQNAFHLHQLSHTHNQKMFNSLIDPRLLPEKMQRAIGANADVADLDS